MPVTHTELYPTQFEEVIPYWPYVQSSRVVLHLSFSVVFFVVVVVVFKLEGSFQSTDLFCL